LPLRELEGRFRTLQRGLLLDQLDASKNLANLPHF
jgi:hypothetical protein